MTPNLSSCECCPCDSKQCDCECDCKCHIVYDDMNHHIIHGQNGEVFPYVPVSQ